MTLGVLIDGLGLTLGVLIVDEIHQSGLPESHLGASIALAVSPSLCRPPCCSPFSLAGPLPVFPSLPFFVVPLPSVSEVYIYIYIKAETRYIYVYI